jgi:hypothetical protein
MSVSIKGRFPMLPLFPFWSGAPWFAEKHLFYYWLKQGHPCLWTCSFIFYLILSGLEWCEFPWVRTDLHATLRWLGLQRCFTEKLLCFSHMYPNEGSINVGETSNTYRLVYNSVSVPQLRNHRCYMTWQDFMELMWFELMSCDLNWCHVIWVDVMWFELMHKIFELKQIRIFMVHCIKRN